MSEEEIVIRYDGPSLADHKMDVEALAPALMALADLCKSVNEKYNGNRASVNLLIDADLEQKCFQFKIQIIQRLLEKARALIEDQEIVTAKEIFEWLGLVKAPVTGFISLLKLLKGRQPDATQLTVQNGKNVMQVTVGRDLIFASPEAVEMLKDVTALNNAAKMSAPNLREGYETVKFMQRGETIETLSKEDAQAISDMRAAQIEPTSTLPESKIRAQVKIRKAVYEGTGKWTIQWDKSRDMAMLDTDWLEKFQSREEKAPPGSFLDVEINVSSIELDVNDNPIREPEYSIIKVHSVVLPKKQVGLFDKN